MPYTAAQLVKQACAVAKCPGFVTQAGVYLNQILSELCTSYEFDVARKTAFFNFATGVTVDPQSGIPASSGPYALPTDWLHADRDDVFYNIQGVKYIMIPESLAEFNSQVQQPGLNAYPEYYAVDNGPIATQGAPLMYVWPPAGGSYAVTIVYYAQMPDITTPETSSTIPWFPYQQYLLRRLTGEMMTLTNDDRAVQVPWWSRPAIGAFMGAGALLNHYLKMKDDNQAVKTVTLDRRQFNNSNWARLQNTKTIGW